MFVWSESRHGAMIVFSDYVFNHVILYNYVHTNIFCSMCNYSCLYVYFFFVYKYVYHIVSLYKSAIVTLSTPTC